MYIPNAHPIQYIPRVVRKQKSNSNQLRNIIGGVITAVVCIGVIVFITTIGGNNRSESRARTRHRLDQNAAYTYRSEETLTTYWPTSKTKTKNQTQTVSKPQGIDYYKDPIPCAVINVTKEDLATMRDGRAPVNTNVFLSIEFSTEQLDKLCKVEQADCDYSRLSALHLGEFCVSMSEQVKTYLDNKILTKTKMYLYIQLKQLLIYSKAFEYVMVRYKDYITHISQINRVQIELIYLRSIYFEKVFKIFNLLNQALKDYKSEIIDNVYQQKFTEDRAKNITFLVDKLQILSFYIPKDGYLKDVTTVPKDFIAFKYPYSARYVIIAMFGELFLKLMNQDIDTLEMTSSFNFEIMKDLIKPEMRPKLGDVIQSIRKTYYDVALTWAPESPTVYIIDTLEENIKQFLKEVAVLDNMFI